MDSTTVQVNVSTNVNIADESTLVPIEHPLRNLSEKEVTPALAMDAPSTSQPAEVVSPVVEANAPTTTPRMYTFYYLAFTCLRICFLDFGEPSSSAPKSKGAKSAPTKSSDPIDPAKFGDNSVHGSNTTIPNGKPLPRSVHQNAYTVARTRIASFGQRVIRAANTAAAFITGHFTTATPERLPAPRNLTSTFDRALPDNAEREPFLVRFAPTLILKKMKEETLRSISTVGSAVITPMANRVNATMHNKGLVNPANAALIAPQLKDNLGNFSLSFIQPFF